MRLSDDLAARTPRLTGEVFAAPLRHPPGLRWSGTHEALFDLDWARKGSKVLGAGGTHRLRHDSRGLVDGEHVGAGEGLAD